MKPIAPWWHTVVFLVIFTAISISGWSFNHSGAGAGGAGHPTPANPLTLYASLIVSEWLLVYVVWRGIHRSGTSLRELVGGRWTRPAEVARDILLALLIWGIWTAFEATWDHVPGAGSASRIADLLPRGALQAAIWIVLSVSAGFAEEIVFRGYLQRQFAALTGSTALAIAIQALVFGAGHAYEGPTACAGIAVYGVFFGLVAAWRRSLRPGMIAHALTDVVAGLR